MKYATRVMMMMKMGLNGDVLLLGLWAFDRILLIASLFIEINAKYPQKASDENLDKSKFGLYYDDIDVCYFYMSSSDVMSLPNSVYIFVCV
jgi:hypothetical protein